jgi:hypothetical protein
MRGRLSGRLALAGVGACLALLACPSFATADATHYQTLQLGERSRGMAAAYTAFAADGAAIWYNPAGLPLLEAKLLQGSLSLFQIRKIKFEGAIVTDGPDGEPQSEDFNVKSSPSLSGFAVASFALGKRRKDYDDRKAWQIGISAFTTYNEQLSGDVQVQDALGRTDTIQFVQLDKQTYIGAAIGWRALKKFLVGLSVFASNRKLDHVETVALSFDGTQNPASGSPCPTSPTIPFCIDNAQQVNRNTVFNMSAWYLTIRIGLMQLIGERWRLGLMFQPPGIQMGGKSTLRFELSDIDATMDPAPSESIFAEIDRGANSPIPWILRLGTSYIIAKKATVALDLQLVGPVGAGQITPDLPQLEGRANTSGVLLSTGTKRVFTWNISVGAEVQFTKYLFTRFGFLTDNSGAPDTILGGDQSQGASLDRYGFSASIGGQKNARGLSAGVTALFGKGTGTGLDFRREAFDTDTNVFPVPVTERIFIISIGGDIGQAADVVTTRLKEKKKEEEAEEAEARAEEDKTIAEEVDPELKTARERAKATREEAETAQDDLEALEAEKKQLENLSKEDQEAIQDATQGGIDFR